MKLTHVLTLAFAALTLSLSAQSSRGQAIEDGARDMTDRMKQALNLSSEQEQLVYRQAYMYQSQRLRLDDMEDMDKALEVYETTRADFTRNMESILDDDQWGKFQNFMKKEKVEKMEKLKEARDNQN